MARPWRVLVVDDRQADDIKEMIEGTRVLGEQDPIEVVTCKTFAEAYPALERERIDLIVLDLKDDEQDTALTKQLAGERVFEKIKQELFVPVIFYTGLAHKVEHLENPFVRVLRREGADKIRTAIQEIFSTRIPQLLRHLEEEKRSYMWDTLLKHNQVLQGADQEEAAFLLARRLANVLESSSVRRFLSGNAPSGGIDPSGIHPVEMYVYPPVEPDLLAGDIIKCGKEANAEYWVILTPSCDLVSGRAKAEQVLLAKCLSLENFLTVVDFKKEPQKHQKELESLIRNRSGKGRQEFRYHFLPATSFLPGFLVDFQNLIQLPFENDGEY
jgi:CheY-like chemotaxis protein